MRRPGNMHKLFVYKTTTHEAPAMDVLDEVRAFIAKTDSQRVLDWILDNPIEFTVFARERLDMLHAEASKRALTVRATVFVKFIDDPSRGVRLEAYAGETVKDFMARNNLELIVIGGKTVDPKLTCAEAGFFDHGSVYGRLRQLKREETTRASKASSMAAYLPLRLTGGGMLATAFYDDETVGNFMKRYNLEFVLVNGNKVDPAVTCADAEFSKYNVLGKLLPTPSAGGKRRSKTRGRSGGSRRERCRKSFKRL